MRKYFLIFVSSLLAVASAVVSCSDSGSTSESASLHLQPSKLNVAADGKDKVSFKVTRDGVDITSSATIWQLAGETLNTDSPLKQAEFSTTNPGSYQFEARYTVNDEIERSEPVIITATNTAKTTFFRRIFAQQFTSTTCPNCPLLSKVLTKLDETDEWNDRLVRAAFHTDYRGPDPMRLSITDLYLTRYQQNGLPALFLDLRKDTHEINVESTIVKQLQRVLNDYPATCGVAIESAYDATQQEIKVTVKVTASETNDYRVLVFLLEDHLIYSQLGAAETEYEHNHTVRYAFCAELIGDKLGTIEAGQEATKTFTCSVSDEWKPENLRIVACAVNKSEDGEYYANNSAMCPIDGSIEYKYNAE